MIDLMASAFGAIIRLIYNSVGQNYGLSIILFTVLTKLVLFPINYKQAKMMKGMKDLAPLEKEIREKYKGNKDKQAEELAKVYQEHRVNPMTGCLSILIQFPIIIAMFAIVRQPLTYIIQVPDDQIIQYAQEILQKEEVSQKEARNTEIQIASEKGLIDMKFLGIDFGATPSNAFNKDLSVRPSKWTILVPILSILIQVLQMIISQKESNLTEEQKQQQKSMNIMFPLLSGFIAYTMPLALGIYWLLGGVLGIISQLLTKMLLDRQKIMISEGK